MTDGGRFAPWGGLWPGMCRATFCALLLTTLVSGQDNGDSITDFDADEFFSSYEDRGRQATPPAELRLPPGFHAELLYTVPLEEQGSWVCLTTDTRGRLIASAQHGGMFRITLPAEDEPSAKIRVESLDVEVGSAQGLLCAFDSLYVVGIPLNDEDREDFDVDEEEEEEGELPALYRLRDTNSDDQFDEVTLLRNFDGEGEHGPHGIVLAPDGESLYLIGGNVCFPTPPPEQSRIATRAGVSRLAGGITSERWMWRRNRVGGWVCRTDPQGQQFELIAMGLRNAYDLAFNADGELFTFDSDMEWDAGMPWYRPTRVNHIISGADFGWRPASSKWPDYFIDSFGSVVDVGFSSPTGIAFGYGARFPDSYQRSLFVGDWSLGYIYAVHMQAQGASYRGEVERFVSGAPLPVTDLVIHPHDGAMYFTVGGRGVTSALYRITYRGDEPTTRAADVVDQEAESRRETRHQLEALHRDVGLPAVEEAWPRLASTDRALRHAARIAVEHQPATNWQKKALAETEPRRLIAVMAALARCGEDSLQGDVVDALGRIDWESIGVHDATDLARVHVLAISSIGSPSDATRERVIKNLAPHFPFGDPRVDQQLAEVLCHIDAPDALRHTLQLLEAAPTQEEQIHYATCVCTLTSGWTPDQKRRFLEWCRHSLTMRGGVSFADYMGDITDQFVDQLTETDRRQFAELLMEPSDPYATLQSRSHVQRWKVSDLLRDVSTALHNRDINNGRQVFADAMCYRCHRFNGLGGITGPDLSAVGRRFNAHDLLEAVVEPSRVVSDQYRSVTITTTDGKSVTGKLTDQSGNILLLMKDALNPANISMVRRDRVDQIIPSNVSLMPEGLLDTFTKDEILDLLAFLLAPDNAMNESIHDVR